MGIQKRIRANKTNWQSIFIEPDNREELAVRWSLWTTGGLNSRALRELATRLDGACRGLCTFEHSALVELFRDLELTTDPATEIHRRLNQSDPRADFDRELSKLPPDGKLIHIASPAYPDRLFLLETPPLFVYIRGHVDSLRDRLTVSTVGSRKASPEYLERTTEIARKLGNRGIATVSGGALGTDAAAHRGALESSAQTVSILPTGIDCPAPRQHRDLFDAIVDDGGALLSEYPTGTTVRPYRFHRRNALIAALGDTTFVARASAESGTMITARHARRLERPVCVLPGKVGHPQAEGGLELLVSGAQCVRGAEDIAETVLASGADKMEDSRVPGSETVDAGDPSGSNQSPLEQKWDQLSPETRSVCSALRDVFGGSDRTRIHRDEIERIDALEGRPVETALVELELNGLAWKLPGTNAFEFKL